MRTSVQQSLPPMPLERLENLHPSMAKANLKNLEHAWRERIGRAIERCFKLAGMTQKEAAGLLNRDQAQVARWIAGTEPQQLHAIFAVDNLRPWMVIALSELGGEGIEVVTEIRVRRIA